jgi:hypothetical protein
MAARSSNLLDVVAEDLAQWIEQIADQMAEAMMAGGQAPFAAPLSEQQKLDYYSVQFFNPDGTPNMQGRAKEMQRLGPEGFAGVFKAVIKAHPEFAVPAPPAGAPIPPSLPGSPTPPITVGPLG